MVEDGGPSRCGRIVLTLVCMLGFMCNYIQYQVSSLAVEMLVLFDMDSVGFSVLFLAPMLTAVFLSVPLGAMGDRFGPKRVVAACSAVAVAGCVLRVVMFESYPMEVASMLLFGVGMAALSVNAVKILSSWHGARIEAAMGGYYASAGLGVVAAQITGSMFPSAFAAYAAAGAAYTVCAALWACFARDASCSSAIPEIRIESTRVAAASRNVWLVSLSAGFSLAATTAYAGLLPQALELGRALSSSASGPMSAVLAVSGVVGCMVGPLVCERLRRMKPFLIGAIGLGSVAMLCSWYVRPDALLWPMLVMNGLFTAMTAPIIQSIPVMLPEIGKELAASAAGIVGTVSLLMSFALPVTVSMVVGDDYAMNFGLESACFLLAAVPVAFIPELGLRVRIRATIPGGSACSS